MVSMQVAALLLTVSGIGETALLDFSAEWCGPCRSMEGTVAQLSSAGYPVRKVNIDREPELARQFHVDAIPCFVMVSEGREVGRIVGPASSAELRSLLAKASSGTSRVASAARSQEPDLPLRPVILPKLRDRIASVFSPPAQGHTAAAVPVPAETARDPLAVASLQNLPGSPLPLAKLVEASVRLTVEDPKGFSYGSGTIIDARQGEALILTCAHIFRDSQGKGTILADLFSTGGPKKLPGRLIAYDLQRDVGLVSIRPGVSVTVARVAPEGHKLSPGDKVISVGCNNGADPTAQESHVTATDKFQAPSNVEVAGQPVQGRSGGGLFTADGLIVGVCNFADPSDNEGIYAASQTIQAQLDAVNLTQIYKPSPAATLAAPPNMPARMPEINLATATAPAASESLAAPVRSSTPALTEVAAKTSPSDSSALSALRQKMGDAEVICIVRPLADAGAKSQVIKLDKASAVFLRQLAAEQQSQQSGRPALPIAQVDVRAKGR